MISAIDETLTPSTDVDLFRIKIWDKDNGDAVVYDNQMGDADDGDATTAIGGGNIAIHKGGNNRHAASVAWTGMVGVMLTEPMLAPPLTIAYWATQAMDVASPLHQEVHVANLGSVLRSAPRRT
jgi:hypothetical protein